jgi:hypothetical protein
VVSVSEQPDDERWMEPERNGRTTLILTISYLRQQIIVIIGKTALLDLAFLRKFCQTCLFRRELDHPVFTSSDLATLFFFTE